VARIGPLAALPSATQSYLDGMNVPQQAVCLNSPELAALNWNALPQYRISTDPGDPGSTIGIAQAFCGIAETGSVALRSQSAVTAAGWFLPEILIVALAASRVYPGQEDCWLRLREQREFPRTLTFMTGPSRTGDIEQKIVIGAHGPKHLHIALYDEP
jgi:L-lactate dehydrogenase complex protein LldG